MSSTVPRPIFCLGNIGLIYTNKENLDQALKHYYDSSLVFKSVDLQKEILIIDQAIDDILDEENKKIFPT